MANDLLDKIPAWLKSVWDMEDERWGAPRATGSSCRRTKLLPTSPRRAGISSGPWTRRREFSQPTARKRPCARKARS